MSNRSYSRLLPEPGIRDSNTPLDDRKFGKQIQKRQLEVPEYAASFVNYKALKKVSCYLLYPESETAGA